MSKSKYPDKIDGSKEIPVLRDDIIQYGAKAINSLRSAIIQIEKTLGLNPNGISGSSLASRLNQSLDDQGNLKKEAFDYLNLISGPINNSDVKSDANISENKLKLDFSTNFLYNQILLSYKNLNELSIKLDHVASSLSSHLNSDAIRRHLGKNIEIEEITNSPSNVSIKETANISLQDLIKSIFDRHINYSGEEMSLENNSHLSKQIFYDKSIVNKLDSINVQSAIDELASSSNSDIISHQLSFHSNGKISQYKNEISLHENLNVSFSSYSYTKHSKGTVITLVTAIDDPGLLIGDFLKIEDLNESSYFNIVDIEYLSGKITSIHIAEDLTFNYSSQNISLVRIFESSDSFPLCISRLQHPDLISNSKIIISSPFAPAIYSSDIKVNKINSSNRYITIESSGKDYLIDCYDASGNNLDKMISRINEQLAEKMAPIICFKFFDEEERICFSHMLESNGTRYIKLKSSSDNSYQDLGLTSFFDKETKSSKFGGFYISGKQYTSLKTKIDTNLMKINAANNITSLVGNDLSEYNIKSGDILIIEGSDNDDGAYIIKSVSNSIIIVDKTSFNFFGQEAGTGARFIVKGSTYSYKDFELTSSFSSGTESGIHELYINESLDIISKKILAYQSAPNSLGNKSLFQITKVINNYEETTSTSFNLDEEDNIVIGGVTDKIVIKDTDKSLNEYITVGGNKLFVYIESYQDLKNEVSSASISFDVKISKSLDKTKNYSIGSITLDNFNGRIVGSDEFSPNFEKSFGNISKKDISQSFLEEYFESYRDLENGNSVIYGCEVYLAGDDGSSNYKFEIAPGKVMVGGKIIEVKAKEHQTEIPFSATSDRIYVGIDNLGNVVYELSNPSGCSCPFNLNDVFLLSVINYSPTYGFSEDDLRIFLNEEGLPRIGSIYVSADKTKRNFRSINYAIKYAKNISKSSKKFGTPIVKFLPGKHECLVKSNSVLASDRNLSSSYRNILEDIYDYGVYLDFPIIIEGSGEDTELSFSHKWSDTTLAVSNSNVENRGKIIIAGSGILSSSYFPQRAGASSLDGKVVFKNIKINNTQIMCFENVSSTMQEVVNSKSNIEFVNLTISSDVHTSFGALDSNIFNYTSLSSSYFYNILKIKNSNLINFSVKFQDEDITTVSSTNDERLSKFIFEENIVNNPTNSMLIYFNNSQVLNYPIYNLEISKNIFSQNSRLYTSTFGIVDNYDSFGSENETFLISKDDVKIISEKTSGNGITLSTNQSDIYLASQGTGGDVRIDSSNGDIVLNCNNSTSGSLNLLSNDYNLSATGNANLDVGYGSYDLYAKNGVTIDAPEGNAIFLTGNSYNAEFGKPNNKITISDEKCTFDNGSLSGKGTIFNGRVSYNSFYQKSYNKYVTAQIAVGERFSLCYSSKDTVSSPGYSSASDAINSLAINTLIHGQWFIPHSDGRIASVSAIQMGPVDLSLVTVTLYKYTGGSSGDPTDINDYDAIGVIGAWASGFNGLDKYDPVISGPLTATAGVLEKGQAYIFVLGLNTIDVTGCNIHLDILIEEDD